VKITVRLFAGLRERAGFARLDVDGVERVDDVWAKLGLGEEPAGLLYAVNRAYVDRGAALRDGDEVALIPPVSGGAFRISAEPLDIAQVVA
jgi:molybdopterin converting factor small subunit